MVTPAPLTVTADDKARVFGAPDPAFTATITGFKNGQNATVLSTQPACDTTANAGSPVATYPITCSGGTATNYTVTTYVPGTLTVNVASSATSVALTGGTAPSVSGQTVTFTATVASVLPSVATPGGTVQFKDGGTDLGSPVTLAGGLASVSTSSLSVTTHSITAVYGGSGNFTGSTSAPLSHTVNAAGTTLTITSDSPDASFVNQSYTVNWTLSVNGPGSGTPTGTVQVTDGAVSCNSAAGLSGSCSLASTSQGAKTLTATYLPDTANYLGSSDTEAHQVNPAPAITVITSDSPDPSIVGQAYSVGVRVQRSSGTGTPSGTVSITDNSGATCNAVLSPTSDGIADGSCFLASASSGFKVLTANYPGDPGFGASSDNESHQVIAPPTPTMTVITSDTPDPSILGAPYSVGVAVVRSSGSGTPSGTVSVTDNAGNSCLLGLTPISDGLAGGSCFLGSTSTGLKVLTASYSGDATFATSSDNEAHQVNPVPLSQTIAFGPLANKTFGDPAFTVSATGGGSGNPVTFSVPTTTAVCTSGVPNGSTITIVGAGTCTVQADQAGGGSYLPATPVSQSFTVAKAVLQVTADNQSRGYGSANPAFPSTITGFVNGQTLATSGVTGSAGCSTVATPSSAVGSYSITCGVGTLASTNYSFTYAPGTLAVTPAVLSVTANNQSRAYGSGNPALTFTATGMMNGDSAVSASAGVSCSTGATPSSAVGSYPINCSGGSNPNYAPSFTPGTLTVTPAPLTVTADDKTKPQGSPNPALTATITGFVLGQTLATSGVSGTPALSTTAVTASPVGTYPITATAGSLAATNYSFGPFVSGTLSVTPSAVVCPCSLWDLSTVPANAAHPDDPSAVELGVKFQSSMAGYITGLRFYKGSGNTGTHIGNLWTSGGSQLATAVFTGETATGWQSVTFSSPVAVAANTIYVASYFAPNGHYAYNRPYFDDPWVNGPLSAPATGTTPNGVFLYGASSGFPTNTFMASNYWVDVVFTTTPPAPQVITFGALANKTYGNAAFTVSATGGGSGNPVTFTTTTPSVCTSGLLNGSTITIGGAGTCTVVANQAGNASYLPAAAVSQSFTVAKAPLTVTGNNASKVYGAAIPALSATLSGFVNGQTLATSGVAGTASCTTTATNSSAVGTYAITCAVGSLTSANYSFGPFVNGTLTVTKAPLTVTADNKTKVQGAANPTLTATITGFVLGQTLATSGVTGSPTLTTTAGVGSPVGSYPITVTGGTLAAANYSFGPFVNGTLTVTAANTPPSVSNIANQSTLEDTPTAAIGFTVGDTQTAVNSLVVTATSSNPALVANGSISFPDSTGTTRTLVATPSANQSGTTTITVTVTDGGGLTAVDTFLLTVTAVNDAPSFAAGANQSVAMNAGAQSVAGWATAISAGPNEAGQTVSFVVTNNNNSLFSSQPAVSAGGTLTYTPASGQSGSATVSVRVQDNGGTANGGVNQSAIQTFAITVLGPKLVITSAAQTLTPGLSSNLITVQRQTAGGSPVTTGTTTVNLSTSPVGSGVFRNSGDSANITTVTISAPSSTATFRYQPFVTGSQTITVSASGYTPGSQVETVNAPKFVFTTAPKTVSPGSTSSAITIQRQTSGGTPLSLGTAVTVTLSVSPSGGGLFRSATSSAFITTVTIAAGSSTASFRFMPLSSGNKTVTVSATGYTAASQVENVP